MSGFTEKLWCPECNVTRPKGVDFVHLPSCSQYKQDSIQVVPKPLTSRERLQAAELVKWACENSHRNDARLVYRLLEPLAQELVSWDPGMGDDRTVGRCSMCGSEWVVTQEGKSPPACGRAQCPWSAYVPEPEIEPSCSDMNEAAQTDRESMRRTHMVRCPACQGEKFVGGDRRPCKICGGEGEVDGRSINQV